MALRRNHFLSLDSAFQGKLGGLRKAMEQGITNASHQSSIIYLHNNTPLYVNV